MSQTAIQRQSDEPSVRGGTSMMSTAIVTLPLVLGFGIAGTGARHELVDVGTRIADRTDLTHLIQQTSLTRFAVDTPVISLAEPTRMQRILRIAPLSRRAWADVFDVSPNAVQKWTRTDPERDKLSQVLAMLEQASRHHADVDAWLAQPVGRSSVTPLELLRDERWRAFAGAVRTQTAPRPQVTAEDLHRRRRDQLPWASPEPVMTSDES